LDRRATTAGFFEVFELFETLELFVVEPGRRAAVDAALSLELDVVPDLERDVEVAAEVLVADPLCDRDAPDANEFDADACDPADRLSTAVLGAVPLAGFDAAGRFVALRCAGVFETGCFDAGGFAVVFDGASCAARFPAARSASVIARFETCKRSV